MAPAHAATAAAGAATPTSGQPQSLPAAAALQPSPSSNQIYYTPLPQHYFTTPNGLIHHPAAAAAGPWAAGAYLPNGAFATQGPFGAAAAAAQGADRTPRLLRQLWQLAD